MNQIHRCVGGSIRSVSLTIKKALKRHLEIHVYGTDPKTARRQPASTLPGGRISANSPSSSNGQLFSTRLARLSGKKSSAHAMRTSPWSWWTRDSASDKSRDRSGFPGRRSTGSSPPCASTCRQSSTPRSSRWDENDKRRLPNSGCRKNEPNRAPANRSSDVVYSNRRKNQKNGRDRLCLIVTVQVV